MTRESEDQINKLRDQPLAVFLDDRDRLLHIDEFPEGTLRYAVFIKEQEALNPRGEEGTWRLTSKETLLDRAKRIAHYRGFYKIIYPTNEDK
jgi:hypothetical protein